MRRQKKQHGMTIVEVMVASTILALVMASAFPLVDNLLGRVHMSRDHYVASSVCQARIERGRQVPYADLELMTEDGSLVDDFGNLAVPGGRFKRTTVIEVDKPTDGMTQMTVTVKICVCSRWGWKRVLHPVRKGRNQCHFTDEEEKMTFLYTKYEKR
jgi:prepilin-type N-terminal cleavage/methylation domain-containing protein